MTVLKILLIVRTIFNHVTLYITIYVYNAELFLIKDNLNKIQYYLV